MVSGIPSLPAPVNLYHKLFIFSFFWLLYQNAFGTICCHSGSIVWWSVTSHRLQSCQTTSLASGCQITLSQHLAGRVIWGFSRWALADVLGVRDLPVPHEEFANVYFNSGQITGWQGFVAVDGAVYNWMGAAPGPAVANQTSATYSSTNTVFTFDVEGKVTLKATFLSPIYPDDLVKQSLQHSYVDVTAVSADGASHSVQVYFDTSGELASGRDASQNITWDHGTTGGVEYHTFQLSNQQQFVEISDQPAWGQWFVSTADTDGVS